MKPTKFKGPDGNTVDAFDIDVTQSTERWCEYELEDGTIIRAKPLITGFVRVNEGHDLEGNPLYAARGSVTHVIVSVPESLKSKEGLVREE